MKVRLRLSVVLLLGLATGWGLFRIVLWLCT